MRERKIESERVGERDVNTLLIIVASARRYDAIESLNDVFGINGE